MNYEKDRKQLIYIILAVVIAFCIYKILGVTILVPMIKDNIVRPFVGECIFTSATVIAAIFVKKVWTIKPNVIKLRVVQSDFGLADLLTK